MTQPRVLALVPWRHSRPPRSDRVRQTAAGQFVGCHPDDVLVLGWGRAAALPQYRALVAEHLGCDPANVPEHADLDRVVIVPLDAGLAAQLS